MERKRDGIGIGNLEMENKRDGIGIGNLEMENKRDAQIKDGKVNEKSKWKNGKIMEVKDEKSR